MGIRIIVQDADFSANKVGSVNLINTNVIDKDVVDYINYVKSKDTTFNEDLYKKPLNILVQKLKLSRLWSKFDVFNLFLGETKESQSVGLKAFGRNDILFFPVSNPASTETIAKFTSEGYETHNSTSTGNFNEHNIAVMPILDEFKSHLGDISMSVTGFIKPDESGSTINEFLFGNLTKSAHDTSKSGRFLLGPANNTYIGLGVFTSPYQPSVNFTTNKKMFTFSLSDNIFNVFENGSVKESVSNVGILDNNPFSNSYIGIGHVTNQNAMIIDGIIQNRNYTPDLGRSNFVFDSLFISKSMSATDIKIFNTIMNEFRTAIGRTTT
jgi:hypothetical protein